VKYQYMSKRNELDKLHFNSKAVKKRRDVKFAEMTSKDKLVRVIKLSLRFLPLSQVFQLRQVCSYWK
jgi:hypothetical protein